MRLNALTAALYGAGLIDPRCRLPFTFMCPVSYLRAGGPFGAHKQ